MNSNQPCSQEDLFKTAPATGMPRVVLQLRGITVQYTKDGKSHTLRGVPSFKTQKTAFGWFDKASGKIMARPLTLPEHKKWMELAIHSIESQLRSIFQITDAKIRTVASPQSWIASLVPLDDSWTWCPEISVKSELCEPGKEGATILIERIQ